MLLTAVDEEQAPDEARYLLQRIPTLLVSDRQELSNHNLAKQEPGEGPALRER